MNTQLIYCSKEKASISNDRDGTFFNEIGNGIVVNEGDEISVEQVCINSIGIGADVIEVPQKIQNYPYSTSGMVFNCFYYINHNLRYMCPAPPNNMTQATDIVTTITAEDYGYISDTYTYPALPVTNLESNNGYCGEAGGRRFYVGTWFSNPNEMKSGSMYPLKAYGGVRVYPTQEGHCFSCLEGNIRFDVDVGYDSPSNIAEKITVDLHSANASVQFGRNNITQIDSKIFGNYQNTIPQLAVLDEDCCNVSINGLAGLYTTAPTSYNFYGAMFATDNPFYLIYGSRLLSKYINDGGSGPKNNELVQVLGAGGVAHDNDIYNVFDLPFTAGPPITTVIPDGYILVTNLPYNEPTLKLLHKFMKTQKIFTEGSTTLNTDDLESEGIKRTYYFPLSIGRQKNNDANIQTALQSPLTDPATQPSQLLYNLKARVFYDETQLGGYTLPADFIAEGCTIADSALITYEGVEYTALNLAKKLDIMIRCVDTGGQGNGELNIAFSMFASSTLDHKGYNGDYCLIDLGLQNPFCMQNVLVNPDLIAGGSATSAGDYARILQVGAPNMNMTFDSVRNRFGIGNMSWPRYLDNTGVTSANPSAGQQAITTNYNAFPIPQFQNGSIATLPYTYYSQSGVGIVTLSVIDDNGEEVLIDQFDADDIKAKFNNSILQRMGFTFRQLANWYGTNPNWWFVQKNYETVKPVTNANAFPYPLTNNLRFDTALNIGLSVNNSNLPMFNLSTQREYFNINIQAQHDTCFAVNLPIKLVTPFYLVKSDIFEGDVAFNSENGGATESIMICTNKAYTSGDYAYSFGTQYSFKASKSFVITGIKTAILKPDLTPADIDSGTAVIYKVVKPVKFFELLEEEQQELAQKSSNKKQPATSK